LNEYAHKKETILYAFDHPEDKIRVHIANIPSACIYQTSTVNYKTNSQGKLLFCYIPGIVSTIDNCLLVCNDEGIGQDKDFLTTFPNWKTTGPLNYTTLQVDKMLTVPDKMFQLCLNGPSSINAYIQKNPNINTVGTCIIKVDSIPSYDALSSAFNTLNGDAKITLANIMQKYYNAVNLLQSNSYKGDCKDGIRQVYYPMDNSDLNLRGIGEIKKDSICNYWIF